jgi:hypothetical protein
MIFIFQSRDLESRFLEWEGRAMVTRSAPGLVAASALLAISGGCSSATADSPDGGASTNFVAYASSFDDFHQWSSATAVADNDAGDGLHGVGPLRVYWNHAPEHGSKTFPVGTIIVKETEGADVTQRAAFAMVKRGPGWNTTGAKEWEWFSLLENTDGSVTVLWRTVPLSGETYANQPIGDCNGCHLRAIANDYVWDTALHLSNF